MQEYVAVAYSGGNQSTVAMAFSAARTCDSLFVEQAAKVGVDQAAFHFPHRHAKGSIGQPFACLPSGEVFSLQDALHFYLRTIPDTGMFYIVNASVFWRLSSELQDGPRDVLQVSLRGGLHRALICLVNLSRTDRFCSANRDQRVHLGRAPRHCACCSRGPGAWGASLGRIA